MSPLDDTETTKILMQMTGDLGHIKSMLEAQNTQIIELKTAVKENHDKGCLVAISNKEQLTIVKKQVFGITGLLNAVGIYLAHLFKGS